MDKTMATSKAVIKPKVRGFICITAHPAGCASHVQEQINAVLKQYPTPQTGPKNVLVIGASTGYGLASRITAALGYNAKTLGVFYERPSQNGKPASAGWYNTVAFEKAALQRGLYCKSINGDAFSNEVKEVTIDTIKNDLGQVDLVIYSLASPKRIDPKDGAVYKSALKPIGQTFKAKTVDTDKKIIHDIEIGPASEEEILQTQKVMGGEDWELWMEALIKANVLAKGATTLAYSYIGPEVTWPIYNKGTIGKAKEHLEQSCSKIDTRLWQALQGRAYVSINKAVATQASSAIPVVPLYVSLLFKVMKEKKLHEDCIEQMIRLFSREIYGGSNPKVDERGRIRLDDWEMRPDVQEAVKSLWPCVTTETLEQISDFAGYQANFLKLFGFGLSEVDYEQEVEIDLPIQNLVETVQA